MGFAVMFRLLAVLEIAKPQTKLGHLFADEMNLLWRFSRQPGSRGMRDFSPDTDRNTMDCIARAGFGLDASVVRLRPRRQFVTAAGPETNIGDEALPGTTGVWLHGRWCPNPSVAGIYLDRGHAAVRPCPTPHIDDISGGHSLVWGG